MLMINERPVAAFNSLKLMTDELDHLFQIC